MEEKLMRKLVSVLLILTIVVSLFSNAAFAIESSINLSSNSSYRVNGEINTISLNLITPSIHSIEFVIKPNTAIDVQSISLDGVQLTPTQKYNYNNTTSTIGMLANVSSGLKVAFTKTQDGVFSLPSTLTIETMAKNTSATHVITSTFTVDSIVLLDKDGQKIDITGITIQNTLEQKILTQAIATKKTETLGLLNALPDPATIMLEQKSFVTAARVSFDALMVMAGSEALFMQTLVDKTKLEACEAKILELTQVATAVSDKIIALPSKDNLVLSNKTALDEAVADFNLLSTPQKDLITPVNKVKLVDLQKQYGDLENAKTYLSASIGQANTAKIEHPVGIIQGNVSQNAQNALNAAIIVATSVHETAATKKLSELNGAIATLKSAIQVFTDSQVTEIDEKKTNLDTLIKATDALITSVTIGESLDQYPQTAKTSLDSVLSYAKAIYNTSSSTIDQYIDAYNKLVAEKVKFEGTKITALDIAKKALSSKLSEAELLVTSSIYGDALDQYPLNAKQPLQDAIYAAKLVDITNKLTVEAATTTLQGAIDTFQSKKVTELTLAKIAVKALFTDDTKQTLASTVTLARISAAKAQVDLLAASADKTSLLGDLTLAEAKFNTPAKVYISSTQGIGNLQKDLTQRLTATAYNCLNIPLLGKTFTWSTSDESKATVSTDGLVTAKIKGTVIITATVDGAPTIKKEVTINVFEVPDLIVSNIPKDSYFNSDVIVNGYRAGQSISIKEGLTELSSGLSSVSATITTEGAHTISFASGIDGNLKTAELSFTIDKHIPTVTIPSIADVQNATVTIPAVTIADDKLLATQSIYLEKKVGLDYVFNKNIVAGDVIKEAGQYRLVAFGKDKAGNEKKAFEDFTITLDLGLPTITVTGVQNINSTQVIPTVTLTGGTNKAQYYFVGTIVKPNQTVVSINGDDDETLAALTEAGRYKLEINAFNPNNASGFTTYTKEFIIDQSVPVITIGAVTNDGKYNVSITPSIQVTDTDKIDTEQELYQSAIVTLKKNGQTISYIKGTTISAEGIYVLTVNAMDSAGKSAVPKSVTFTIDKTKPVINITNLTNGEVYYANITSTMTTDSDVASFTIKDELGNNIVLTNHTKTFYKVNNDTVTYVINATATDYAGNITTKKLTFVIDNLAVSFNVLGITEGAVVKQIPDISCSIIDGSQQIDIPTTIVDEGLNTLSYDDGIKVLKLSYANGDKQADKNIKFRLDATSPVLGSAVISVNGTSKNSDFTVKQKDKLTLSINATDASELTSVYATIGNFTSNITLVKGNDSTYTADYTIGTGNYMLQPIKFYAVDQVGNIKWLTSLNVTVDNNVPMANATMTPSALPNGLNGYYTNGSTAVILSTNDTTATIRYSMNGAIESDYTIPLAPIEGSNTVTYYAIDPVGNKSEMKTFTFLFDKTSPLGVTLSATISPIKTQYIDLVGTVAGEGNKGTKVIFEQNGNIVGIAQVGTGDAFGITALKLLEGLNSFKLYAKDYAGNIGPITTYEITLDTTAPIIELQQIDENKYVATMNEVISGGTFTAVFNGTSIAGGSISVDGSKYTITTPAPLSGQNMLVVTANDLAGNEGSGSMSTNYMPPSTAQSGVQVTNNTTLDIPSNAFSGTTILTVQTTEVEGNLDYKPLGAPIKYSFTTPPTNPIIVTNYIGTGLSGVGIIHIADDGTPGVFIPALVVDIINYNDLIEDQPYYSPESGLLVLKTKNFSTYQTGQDTTSPMISLTTTDFEIISGDNAAIAGTITDQDTAAKITQVIIDGVTQVVSLQSPFSKALTLIDGTHEVILVASDTAGNTTAITKTYIVDKTIPVLNISLPMDTTDQATGTIALNTSELVTLKVNGKLIGSAQGITNLTVELPIIGDNLFTIVGQDAMGNVKTDTLTIKRIAQMQLSVNALMNTTAATINITGSINVTADLYVNDIIKNAHQAAGNFTITNYPIVMGLNTLVIKAFDGLGNEVVRTVTITRTAVNPGDGGVIPGGVNVGLPVITESSTKEVTNLGGTIEFKELGITIDVPVNTFTDKVEISVNEVKTTGQNIIFENGKTVTTQVSGKTASLSLAGKVYEFSSTGTLNKPVQVTLSFEPSTYNEEQMSKLGVYYLNVEKGQWEYVKGTIDVVRGTITVTLNHFSIYAVMSYSKTFDDIKGHWAKAIIEDLASRHIVGDIADAKFYPQRQMTRAEFAKIIVNALNLKLSTVQPTFEDVNADSWYASYVMAAKEEGIIGGYSDNTFKPNATITRQEIAVMVMNAYNYTHKTDYKTIYTGTGYQFADGDQVSSWAKQAVEGAKILGVIGGKGNNVFDPKAYATRAEVAKMIQSFLAIK